MDYLPYFLKRYDLDLQPSNSVCVDVNEATDILYPGAHIATSNPYEHYHHGIVVDVNTPEISIIHLWGEQKETSRIQRTTLPIFLAGGVEKLGEKTRRLYLVNYEGDSLEKRQQTVQTAEEMLDTADPIVYNLVNLNCESFACFCRTGQWNSEQVQRLKLLLRENAEKIYERVQNADEKNKKAIQALLQTMPIDALTPHEKQLYDQLLQDVSN